MIIMVGSLSAGCAASGPSQELLGARQALDRAVANPDASYAPRELRAAQQSLLRAEQAEQREGRSRAAIEQAYEAKRAAERARIASRAARDREALATAERRVERLRLNVARAKEAERERRRRVAELDVQRAERRQARAEALEELAAIVHIERDGARTTFSFQAAEIFERDGAGLTQDAMIRLRTMLGAMRRGPASTVLVEVTASRGDAPGTNDYALAKRRAARLREILLAMGLPFEDIGVAYRAGSASVVRLTFRDRPEAPPPVVMQSGAPE